MQHGVKTVIIQCYRTVKAGDSRKTIVFAFLFLGNNHSVTLQ